MKIYRNVSEYALTGGGWLIRDKEFDAKDVVTVDDMIDLITQLAMHPHYNPDDNVQQFMLDIKKELESKDGN